MTGKEQHTAVYIRVWHIRIEGLPIAAGQAQHTAAYISTWHIIMVSQQDTAALAQHTAASLSARQEQHPAECINT